MFTSTSVIFAISLLGCALAIPPPSYLKPCSPKDANFKKCLVDTANQVFPTLAKGDKKHRIPPINPLKLSAISIKHSNLEINFKDIDIYGLDQAKFTDIDFSENELRVVCNIPKLEIIGPYTAKGKILIIQLNGSGRSNITAVNGKYIFTNPFTTVEKNGQQFLQMGKLKLEYKLERAYFNLENLLGDDVGIDVNTVLNDNWEAVLNDLGSSLETAVEEVYKLIISNLFNRTPKKDFLLE